ncbi:MAG: hypothetical protein JJU02_02435 [Cryomorphaceae bacterium]|nr:hypothetical protein [Cryomorphaceae bacterium]
MNYDIKIENNREGRGRLELDRIGFLAKQLKSISKKALLLQMFGYSKVSLPRKYNKYLNVYLTGQQQNDHGVALNLGADNFSGIELQLDAFRDKTQLHDLTPISLIISTFRAALEEGEDMNLLDEPLIDELIHFKKFFQSDEETVILSNRGSIPEVRLTNRIIGQIEHLYKSIPDPQKTIINGVIDEMKFSKKQLVLLTAEKERVVVMPKAGTVLHEVSDFFGKEITLTGMAHFKPGGQLSYVELESFAQPSKGDHFFSKKPSKMGVQQQIAMQLREGKKANPLDDIIGKWPGDETDEEFDEMMKLLD